MFNIQKKLGFGAMRLPMVDGKVDTNAFSLMVDHFLEQGFNYFDTAHGYLDGQSEHAIRVSLADRYPREAFVLADKLSSPFFKTEADIRPLFEAQLKACGVSYFDFYLMHAQNAGNFDQFVSCRAYETAFALKEEGKIRHVGLSFHDSPAMLDKILTTYPQVEFVQIQFNYLDYEDPKVQSRGVYEVCRKHHKPVVIMEPVKGGTLANLPEAAKGFFDALDDGYSPAGYALRYAAGFPDVIMVLSGMGSLEMVEDNTRAMKRFHPLSPTEKSAIKKVVTVLRGQDVIPCTGCRYCTEGCPAGIDIPALFALRNENVTGTPWNRAYEEAKRESYGDPSSCLACGACEGICPQKLPIRELLTKLADGENK